MPNARIGDLSGQESMEIAVSHLISVIQSRFKDGPPNGWLLGWSEDRFCVSLRRAVNPCKLLNCTGFDYSFCNEYEVVVPISSWRGAFPYSVNDHSTVNLTIQISFIADFYSVYWVLHGSSKSRNVVPNDATLLDLEVKVRRCLELQEFSELPSEWYSVEVPDVELDLAGRDNVTVAKCLFNDRDG